MNNKFQNIDEITSADVQKESLFKKTVFSIFFIWTYQYIHINYLCEVWSYMRYFKNELDFSQVFLTYIVALFPIYFYSGLKQISSYFSIIIYIMCYVPIVVTLSYNNTDELGYNTVLLHQVVLAFSMSFFFLVDKIKTIKSKRLILNIPIFWFHVFTILTTLYLVYKFSGNMRFVGFEDIYDLRSENSQFSDPISQYLTMWATYLIYPIYFSLGLVKRQKMYLLIGILGHIMIYMISGAKASILMPVIIFLIYIVVTKIKYLSFSQSLAFFVSSLSLLLFKVDVDSLFLFRSIFLMRTLSMPGYLFSNYLSFFSNHPYTQYSHIGIVNSFTNSYPYGDIPIGVVIGDYDMTNANANANFWATDGVAAYGLMGIVIITITMIVFFIVVNNLLKDKKTIFSYLVFTGTILSLLNVSFFTTLLSSGLLLLVLFVYAFDFEEDKEKEQQTKSISDS